MYIYAMENTFDTNKKHFWGLFHICSVVERYMFGTRAKHVWLFSLSYLFKTHADSNFLEMYIFIYLTE